MTTRKAGALIAAAGSARRARTETENRDAAIRRARAEGVSLRALANATGLSHTAIAKIERR